jgi:hypothetical protein
MNMCSCGVSQNFCMHTVLYGYENILEAIKSNFITKNFT